MQSGPMRHRITIERPARIEDATTGEVVINWTPVRTVWGSVRNLTARELVAYAQTYQLATGEVRLRYTPDVTPDSRLKFGSRTLSITGVINVDERNRELRILTAEGK